TGPSRARAARGPTPTPAASTSTRSACSCRHATTTSPACSARTATSVPTRRCGSRRRRPTSAPARPRGDLVHERGRPRRERPRRKTWAERNRRERGVVLVWFTLLLVAILAFVGFAIDLSNWWYQAQKLQRAADAGAHAG